MTTDAFEVVMASIDYPMMVVTAATADERSGCLVGFGTQVSIDPQRFAVWLSKENHTYRLAVRTDVLAVHFLSADERDLADLFGGETGDEIDKFSECEWDDGPGGVPILNRVTNWFAGRVVDRVDAGDHVGHLLSPFAGRSSPWSGQLSWQQVRNIAPGHPA
jgi:flavin reductase (DIM6/NTAB) family NADH-FMN oxidoreductase RutF